MSSISPSVARHHVGTLILDFRGSILNLHIPLSTLHVRPYDRPRMTRGHRGLLRLPVYGSFIRYSTPILTDAFAKRSMTYVLGRVAQRSFISRALTDPYMILSHHTAPRLQTVLIQVSSQCVNNRRSRSFNLVSHSLALLKLPLNVLYFLFAHFARL